MRALRRRSCLQALTSARSSRCTAPSDSSARKQRRNGASQAKTSTSRMPSGVQAGRAVKGSLLASWCSAHIKVIEAAKL